MAKQEPVLRGSDETTPVRALNRVALVILVAVVVIGAIAYGLYAAFGGRQTDRGSAPATVSRVA